ncbi:MAG: response regulator [Polyangiaceae bacterium]
MHRLLLIDDDEALAGPLAQYLARFDLQLQAVTRPSEAQARLAAERFDALILDGMLPEMDGFEFCKRLRGGNAAWRDIPRADADRARRSDGPRRRPGTGGRRLPAQALRAA